MGGFIVSERAGPAGEGSRLPSEGAGVRRTEWRVHGARPGGQAPGEGAGVARRTGEAKFKRCPGTVAHHVRVCQRRSAAPHGEAAVESGHGLPCPGRPGSTTAVRTVHVVPHTHWDREWYLPFQTFRMRLVGLIDGLIDAMEADPRLAFTLDGQLATVDDYLEIRPEREERVRALIRAGRLAVGPWLILMDEFLVSGETIVRNLEAGTRRAEELGGSMAVGYLPDMFGHVAQMPQILRRAGIGHAVVWRGVPEAIDRHAFRWIAPDGSTVRTEYLLGGYGNARDLFMISDPAIVRQRVARYVRSREPIFGDRPILAMYGEDHSLP